MRGDATPQPPIRLTHEETAMDDYDRILRAIYEAMREISELDSDQILVEAPDTVLLGETSGLNSLCLVSLAAVVEANIEHTFEVPVSVMDTIMAAETPSFDVAALASGIARRIGCPAPA